MILRFHGVVTRREQGVPGCNLSVCLFDVIESDEPLFTGTREECLSYVTIRTAKLRRGETKRVPFWERRACVVT